MVWGQTGIFPKAVFFKQYGYYFLFFEQKLTPKLFSACTKVSNQGLGGSGMCPAFVYHAVALTLLNPLPLLTCTETPLTFLLFWYCYYVLLIFFIFYVESVTFDCDLNCTCSKANCTAGQYWTNCSVGCVECPAGS